MRQSCCAKLSTSAPGAGELVMFSGNTDCYQPLEATWRLTRACLEICAEYRNPAGIITRSLLVQRDLDVLQRLHAQTDVRVFFSISFADDATARAIEPQAPLVSRRFEAMRRVAAAGIPTGISVAPIIPGLNDDDIASILERAWDAGARYASHVLLRLPGSVRTVFLERLRAALPDRAQRVENRIRETRGGALSDPRFGDRMRGHGVYWDMIEKQWEIHTRRIGFTAARSGERATRTNTFRRPTAESPQGTLFADGGGT